MKGNNRICSSLNLTSLYLSAFNHNTSLCFTNLCHTSLCYKKKSLTLPYISIEIFIFLNDIQLLVKKLKSMPEDNIVFEEVNEGNPEERPREPSTFKQPIIGMYTNLYEELIEKCAPENFLEPYEPEKASIANELYAQILACGEENKNELAYKSDYFKYITELGIEDVYINIKKDGKYGYINQNGEVVIDFLYDYASPFVGITAYNKHFDIALVCQNGSS